MAGHSKWKQIKRKKAVADQKRGGDPAGNPRLRTAIDAAKAENMPQDNIERAIKKGTGELEGVVYQEVTYEGYGPGGAAILIEATTDNPNRTVADIRHVFTRDGDVFLITTPVNRLHAVHDQLTAKRIPVQSAEVAMIPKSTVKVQGGDAKRMLQLIEALEEMDDVARVFSNFDIDAEALAAVTG